VLVVLLLLRLLRRGVAGLCPHPPVRLYGSCCRQASTLLVLNCCCCLHRRCSSLKHRSPCRAANSGEPQKMHGKSHPTWTWQKIDQAILRVRPLGHVVTLPFLFCSVAFSGQQMKLCVVVAAALAAAALLLGPASAGNGDDGCTVRRGEVQKGRVVCDKRHGSLR